MILWRFSSLFLLSSIYTGISGPGEVPTKPPSALKCLKRLYLSELCFDELVKVAWALCLLRSSPYLEELEIKGPGDLSGELIDYVPWWTVDEIPASFSDVTYNYLRTVKIKGLVGAGVGMQLIKVLLAKSPVLLRMVIDPYVEGDHSLEILAKITKYQRASPQAEVIYNVNVYPGYKPARCSRVVDHTIIFGQNVLKASVYIETNVVAVLCKAVFCLCH
ncbi:hypothetical protein KY284_003024 [Solanum tuberosum]|nr:hypothetical protein KY284_003024 [Solanum tuberosum]